MRKILAITSIRSEYDLMSRLYQLLHADPEVELQLLVSGAHLSPSQGYTVDLIRADGFTILAEIETLISADSASSRLKTASCLLAGSIDWVRKYNPDLIIYAGDREDVLVGAMLGSFLGIPTAHFFAGDHSVEGHIDNPIRHAASKLSSAHFVSIAEHKQRLMCMGESASRIFTIGSIALDKFLLEPVIDLKNILDKIGAGEHAYQSPLALLIFHPIEEEKEVAADYIINATQALIAKGYHVCVGSPNTDPGNFHLFQTLSELSVRPEVTFYHNLSRTDFVNLMRNTQVMVGNSSAGLLEAATLKLPAINIGLRQKGRLCSANVIFVDGQYQSILKALETISGDEFQATLTHLKNIYGDGHSSELAVDFLKATDFLTLIKKTEDPLNANGQEEKNSVFCAAP